MFNHNFSVEACKAPIEKKYLLFAHSAEKSASLQEHEVKLYKPFIDWFTGLLGKPSSCWRYCLTRLTTCTCEFKEDGSISHALDSPEMETFELVFVLDEDAMAAFKVTWGHLIVG